MKTDTRILADKCRTATEWGGDIPAEQSSDGVGLRERAG